MEKKDTKRPKAIKNFYNYGTMNQFEPGATQINYYYGSEKAEKKLTEEAAEVPAELAESGLWEKVKEAGLVNEGGQPTVSRTEAAILADILLEKMGKEHEWTLFEKMWNRKNMRNDWQAALELKKFDEVREKIKKKLC